LVIFSHPNHERNLGEKEGGGRKEKERDPHYPFEVRNATLKKEMDKETGTPWKSREEQRGRL